MDKYDFSNMNFLDLISKAETENEDLNDYGDIPPESYRMFKELIARIRIHLNNCDY